MAGSTASNVWKADFTVIEPRANGARVVSLLDRDPSTGLRSSVWELPPGGATPKYHLHHATEELLVLLEGHADLRTPDGVRPLEPGDVVHFPVGPTGAHQEKPLFFAHDPAASSD